MNETFTLARIVTGTPINVQSLLGVIFMVGIVVSNTVLLTDFAQNLRTRKGLSPDRGHREAASDPRRLVVMTALAAFFALLPMALACPAAAKPTPRWAAP